MIGRYDLLGHLSNVLYTVAFFFKDILWLRILVIAGCAVELVYRFNIADTPLWTDIFWCGLFIVLNTYQLAVLIYNRQFLSLTSDEKKLRKKMFSNLSVSDFKALLNAGIRKQVPSKTVLIEEKVHLDCLQLLVKGKAEVIVEGKLVTHLKDCSFAGEMSFLTGSLTSARVVTTKPTHCIIWHKDVLQNLMNSNDSLHQGLQTVFNKDLIHKLLQHSQSATAPAHSNPAPDAATDEGLTVALPESIEAN